MHITSTHFRYLNQEDSWIVQLKLDTLLYNNSKKGRHLQSVCHVPPVMCLNPG